MRGETKLGSDLDMIAEFEERKSLLELVGIEQELEDNLGIKIDLLTEEFRNKHSEITRNFGEGGKERNGIQNAQIKLLTDDKILL